MKLQPCLQLQQQSQEFFFVSTTESGQQQQLHQSHLYIIFYNFKDDDETGNLKHWQ